MKIAGTRSRFKCFDWIELIWVQQKQVVERKRRRRKKQKISYNRWSVVEHSVINSSAMCLLCALQFSNVTRVRTKKHQQRKKCMKYLRSRFVVLLLSLALLYLNERVTRWVILSCFCRRGDDMASGAHQTHDARSLRWNSFLFFWAVRCN